jgi:dihydropteroate synthase
MNDFWGDMIEATIETMRFTYEAQSVVSARLFLFATGAPNAVDEAAEMVAEKIKAFSQAGIAAERALSDGLGVFVAAERAYSPLRDCVHANSDRLSSEPR